MVVEEVQDVDLAAVGELPVRHVGLPAFVGKRRLESHPGASGALVRLRGDETPSASGSARWSRRDGTCSCPAVARWKWIVAAPASKPERVSSHRDAARSRPRRPRGAVRDAAGSARARSDRLVAAFAEATDDLAHPALRHPVGLRHLAVAPSLAGPRPRPRSAPDPSRTPSIGVHDVPTQVSTMW